ncbi:MAG: peptidoglycan-binding protein [Acidobacteria bacterium]|nr:peptidoglycan-binding protein [Acidobacteriota bacterium]
MKKLLYPIFLCLALSLSLSAQSGSNNAASTSTSGTKRGPVFRATKEQVMQIQTLLKQNGTYGGEIDGKFSSEFREAIKDFQAKNELKKTGTVNRATLEKMGIDLTDKQKEYPVNPNSFDTSDNDKADKPAKNRRKAFRPTKDQIILVQTKLKDTGAYNGEISGKYNKALRTAIREFQSANGLKRKGSLNRATLEKMGIELTEAQAAIAANPDDLASAGSKDGGNSPKRKIFRATKEQITKVQEMLRSKGLYGGEATGKLNPETRKAIGEWQAQNNVNKTGTLNKATLEALGVELTDAQKDF